MGDFVDRADSFSPWLPEVGSSVGSLLVLRKAWYWFQKPAELLVAGMFKEVIDVEGGCCSAEERLLRAGGRVVLVSTPWCFMCPLSPLRLAYSFPHSAQQYVFFSGRDIGDGRVGARLMGTEPSSASTGANPLILTASLRSSLPYEPK